MITTSAYAEMHGIENWGNNLKGSTSKREGHVRSIGTAALVATSIVLTGCTYSDTSQSIVAATKSPQASSPAPSTSSPAIPGVAGEIGFSSYQLPITYTTVEGDTWASIAAAFELKEESLKAFQLKQVPAVPVAGSVVDLRGVDYKRPGARGDYVRDAEGKPSTYVIQSGDNPGDVAARFGIPVRNLVGDNDLPGKWSLKPEDSASFIPGTTLKLQNPS